MRSTNVVTYRRPARPSGHALRIAEDLARARLEAARAEHDTSSAALETLVTATKEELRQHEDAVVRADEARTRALRLAMARAPGDSVPERLRDSMHAELRQKQLTRALSGPVERDRSPVIGVKEAMAALERARTERARAYAASAVALEHARAEVLRTRALLSEAEDDVRRLEG